MTIAAPMLPDPSGAGHRSAPKNKDWQPRTADLLSYIFFPFALVASIDPADA